MKLSVLIASALAIILITAAPQARAFTVDGQTGNTSNGTARFADPDESVEKTADPSGSGGLRAYGSGSPADPLGSSRVFEPMSVPTVALPGGGDNGFYNSYNSRHNH